MWYTLALQIDKTYNQIHVFMFTKLMNFAYYINGDFNDKNQDISRKRRQLLPLMTAIIVLKGRLPICQTADISVR